MVGRYEYASFTDETSLHSRETARRKVYVHAQVLPEPSLEWFYELRKRCLADDPAGETKSTAINAAFFSLAAPEKQRIFSTLKAVRIHITDPRLYVAEIERTLPERDIGAFLVSVEQLQHGQGTELKQAINEYLTRRILDDSPAQRVRRLHLNLEFTSGLRIDSWLWDADDDEDSSVPAYDFKPFEELPADVVRRVTLFVSKSNPVFAAPLDVLNELTKQRDLKTSLDPFWRVHRSLTDAHAFDEGNDAALRWIRGERAEVLSRVDRYGMFGQGIAPGPLEAIDSQDSPFVQAADIAAGLVRGLWTHGGLTDVVRRFDYVTYNGTRLSESDAARIQRSLSALHN